MHNCQQIAQLTLTHHATTINNNAEIDQQAPPGLRTQMPVGQMPIWGGQNTRHTYKGQQNIRATARENTGQNTKGTHPVPREVKIPDPAGVEGRDSKDHAISTD